MYVHMENIRQLFTKLGLPHVRKERKHGKKKTANIHRISASFYSVALQWIAPKFLLVNITFFYTQCNYFDTILQILRCDNATG